MSLTKYNNNLPANFFRFFDDHATQSRSSQRRAGQQPIVPAVNIMEQEDKFVLDIIAPGRDKANFSVELNDALLTISYTAKETEDTPKLLRREFTIGNFKRSFKLDAKVVDGEQIAAVYENGILSLTLPKLEEAVAKGPQQIKVA